MTARAVCDSGIASDRTVRAERLSNPVTARKATKHTEERKIVKTNTLRGLASQVVWALREAVHQKAAKDKRTRSAIRFWRICAYSGDSMLPISTSWVPSSTKSAISRLFGDVGDDGNLRHGDLERGEGKLFTFRPGIVQTSVRH